MYMRIQIYAEQANIAQACKDMLRSPQFSLTTMVSAATAAAQFDNANPNLLILAFEDLEVALRRYAAIYCRSKLAQTSNHLSAILCSSDTIHRAYELCSANYFDLYQMFWPMDGDPLALEDVISEAQHLLTADQPRVSMAEKMLLYSRHVSSMAAEDIDEDADAKPGSDYARSILLIDDDVFQHKAQRLIFNAGNFDFRCSDSVVSGIHELRRRPADLIIMDYEMPGMDGVSGVQRIREMSRYRHVPIIMLTGSSAKSVVKNSLQAGANDFIVKPYRREVLMAKVERYLHQYSATA